MPLRKLGCFKGFLPPMVLCCCTGAPPTKATLSCKTTITAKSTIQTQKNTHRLRCITFQHDPEGQRCLLIVVMRKARLSAFFLCFDQSGTVSRLRQVPTAHACLRVRTRQGAHAKTIPVAQARQRPLGREAVLASLTKSTPCAVKLP